MLYLSQPVGTGFSYGKKVAGSIDPVSGNILNSTQGNVTGRYPVSNATEVDTTDLAAMAAWEVMQAFFSAMPQLDSGIQSKEFNLMTESYGGHYGPAFFNYFYDQNQAIANGTQKGKSFNFNSLGIINGIIDEAIQAPYYPEFAVNNTYGIKSVNDTVYSYMKFAAYMDGGCLDQIATCYEVDISTLDGQAICSEVSEQSSGKGTN